MSSTRPLHARVADELRQEIVSGELGIGQQVGSEAQLSARFQASRGTIRQALATLRHEGLIGGGQGAPAVVRSVAVGQPFETFMSFTAWAERIGRTPGSRTIEVARRGATFAAAQALQLDEGAPVIDVLRLRTLDGQPALLERSTFVEPVGRRLFDFDSDGGSIYAFLQSQGVEIAHARHTVDAVAADEVDADWLEVPVGSPLLRERRSTADHTGVPIEYGDARYRPDRVSFTIENTVSRPGVTPDLRVLKEMS